MTLVKFNRAGRDYRFPFTGTPFYGDVLNTLFDTNTAPSFQPAAGIPPVNLSETEDHYLVELAAPGYKKEDFQLNLEDGKLTVSGEAEKKAEASAEVNADVNNVAPDNAFINNEAAKHYSRREFEVKVFSRSFTLPDEADQNAVNAVYENGILSITIGKREDVKLRKVARKIEIK